MYILGINPSIDASSSLINENEIVAAASEERFERIKHIRAFPYKSMNYCFLYGKKNISDIDAVAICWNPGIHINNLSSLHGANKRHYSELLIQIPYFLLKKTNSIASNTSYIKQEIYLNNESKPLSIYYLNHHLSHAASAFFLSPFKHAAILTMDGYGEEASILMSYGKGNSITPIKEILFPDSIGSLYAAVTQYLGFLPNQDEGKVMGLAAWGKPAYYNKFKKIIKITSRGELELDLSYFSFYMERRLRISSKFINEFGAMRNSDEPITQHYKNIACSLQKIVEDITLNLVQKLYENCKTENLCLAGGVTLNCALNGNLKNKSPFENIFVPSAPGDDGNSLGAALYLKHVIMKQPRIAYSNQVYLGPCYEEPDIEKILNLAKVKFIKCENSARIAARLLAKNKIIGWFQGRAELGPRALGNRSILAHPGENNVKERLDKKIKLRAEYRPYAPAILKEKFSFYFDGEYNSPYMSFCAKVNTLKKGNMKNVIHKDNTSRVQIIDKNINPLFYSLIAEFEKITGLPLILNTSLNTNGEPIVNTIEQALHMFFTSDLDVLFLEKYLIVK
ncbi:carbamoyl transferase [Candidatus Poribacteria bacterium]|nr:carbamoyl transferase [Candidatus Poribacteria bacterium]